MNILVLCGSLLAHHMLHDASLMRPEPKSLSNNALILQLETLVMWEKQSTTDVVEYIQEVENRRLYLDLGYTSLFAYLAKGLGYTPASAQRRIESARLMRIIPEIKADLLSGALNLTQLSMVAHGIRQKAKSKIILSTDDKRNLLAKIKNQDIDSTQKTIAETLNLPIETEEKIRMQKDDSVRMELTFTKEEMQKITRVKELISHKYPNPTWAELITCIADDFLQRKDPQRKPNASVPEAAPRQLVGKGKRTPIPAKTRRFVFQRDQFCQWTDPQTGKPCKSKFQLQIDHRFPVWAGGSNDPANLQVLCSVHNLRKYEKETDP